MTNYRSHAIGRELTKKETSEVGMGERGSGEPQGKAGVIEFPAELREGHCMKYGNSQVS